MDPFRGYERGDDGGFCTPSSRAFGYRPPLPSPTNINPFSPTSTIPRPPLPHLPTPSKTPQKKLKPLRKEAIPTIMPPSLPLPSDPVSQVKTFIQDSKANGYRRILATDEEREFKIPLQDWFKLRPEFDFGEERAPFQYSYDASKSILTIKGPPSRAHEAVVGFVDRELTLSIPQSTSIDVLTADKMSCDEGQYKGSNKVPDLAIQERDSKGNWKTKWVLEVGFSEKYEKLKSDMELMLKGNASKIIQGALVKIVETPKYRCPIPKEQEFTEQHWKDPETFEAEECYGEQYGPISYQGRQWVGEISNIFWETWQLDVETNEIQQVWERYTIYPPSATSKPFPPIQLDHLLSNAPNTQPLQLDWDFFREKLQNVMTVLVLTRYREWYDGRRKKEGDDPKDRDYDGEEEKKKEEDEEEKKKKKKKKKKKEEGEDEEEEDGREVKKIRRNPLRETRKRKIDLQGLMGDSP